MLATEDAQPVLVSELLVGTFLSSLLGVGDHRVGLAPKQEISQAAPSAVPDLVSGDFRPLLIVDTAHLLIESVPETPTTLPTAPGLTNHLAFRVRVTPSSFGSNMSVVIPWLSCALVSQSATAAPVAHTYFSEFTIVLEDYDQLAPPSAIGIEFIMQAKEDVPHEGAYCVKLVFNGQLTNQLCSTSSSTPADPVITVWHLPATIYSRATRPCNVERQLADYTHLDRNYASHLAVVDGTLQYQFSDGALLCTFDPHVYDFLQ